MTIEVVNTNGAPVFDDLDGWAVFEVLQQTRDEFTRVACAEALLSAGLPGGPGLKPHHFLDLNENLEASFSQLNAALAQKIGKAP